MATNSKYTTTIRISKTVREKLRQQADKIGLDMSAYIAYLVMFKEQQDKKEKETKALMTEFFKMK